MRTPAARRAAFTLVELLVVMAIITLLAAILVPTVGRVLRRAKNARIALELNQIQQAIEAYKLKYGDYPPDFSNRVVVERHIRKAFPRISREELNRVRPLFWLNPADPADHRSYLDPAEALVFWLGGFSADPKAPFTGEGGPLKPLTTNMGVTYVANPDRNSPFFQFQQARLTLQSIGGSVEWISSDERGIHNLSSASPPPNTFPPSEFPNDPYPVYLPPGLEKSPYVYFDSRTYTHNPINSVTPSSPPPPPPQYPPQAFRSTTSVAGVARPYRSDDPRQPTSADAVPFKWVNDKTFQLITAGLDEDFGADHLVKRFPSGQNYAVDPPADDDNLCNFSEGRTLGDFKE